MYGVIEARNRVIGTRLVKVFFGPCAGVPDGFTEFFPEVHAVFLDVKVPFAVITGKQKVNRVHRVPSGFVKPFEERAEPIILGEGS